MTYILKVKVRCLLHHPLFSVPAMLDALVHFTLFQQQLSSPVLTYNTAPSFSPKTKPFKLELGTILTEEFRLVWGISHAVLLVF